MDIAGKVLFMYKKQTLPACIYLNITLYHVTAHISNKYFLLR
jgi:hypothetical protein